MFGIQTQNSHWRCWIHVMASAVQRGYYVLQSENDRLPQATMASISHGKCVS